MAIKIPIKHTVENGTGPSSAPDRGVNGTRRDDIVAETDNETENENEDNENNENDEEEEEDSDGGRQRRREERNWRRVGRIETATWENFDTQGTYSQVQRLNKVATGSQSLTEPLRVFQ